MKKEEASIHKFGFLEGFVLGGLLVGIFVGIFVFLLTSFYYNSANAEESPTPEVSNETYGIHDTDTKSQVTPAPTPTQKIEIKPSPTPTATPEPKETPYETPEPDVTPSIDVKDYDTDALISIASELSLEGADGVTYCAIAKMLYKRGAWDGTPYELGSHTVSISEGSDDGHLLVDGKNICHDYEHLDLPKDLTFDDYYNSDLCVPGKGTFAVINDSLVLCSRGAISKYGRKTSDWDGIDTNKYLPYRYQFFYDEASDTLFLMTVTMPKDTEEIVDRVKRENDVLTPAERKLADGTGVYLYKFPDCDLSKMEFVSQINGYLMEGSFLYLDMNDTFWNYQVLNGKYKFVALETKNFLSAYPLMAHSQGLMKFLNHTFPYSPFYGYYCCCGLECYGECKSCCNCKYCS